MLTRTISGYPHGMEELQEQCSSLILTISGSLNCTRDLDFYNFRIAEEYSNWRCTREYQKSDARRRNANHLKSIKVNDGRDLYLDNKAKKVKLIWSISDIPNFGESQVDFEIRVASCSIDEISEDHSIAADLQEYQELICSEIQSKDCLSLVSIMVFIDNKSTKKYK